MIFAELLLLASATATIANPLAACPSNADVNFSCRIAVRRLSICGAGSSAKLRIIQNARVVAKANGATYARRGYSGGGEAQVIFRSKRTSYIVYSSTVRTAFGADGRHDAQQTTGLFVQRDGRKLSEAACEPASIAGSSWPSVGDPPLGRFVDR